MKIVAVCAFLLGTMVPALAQDQARPSAVIHHAVSANAQAQAAFDRGLLDYYAYNPEAAEHEFYTAADLDRHLAMAYWGIAISNAPNLNVDPTDDRDEQAREAIQRAKKLETYATPEDQQLINAAAVRFDGDKKAKTDTLEIAYRDALQQIAIANPNDPDVATLYAEAALYVTVHSATVPFDKMTPEQTAAFQAEAAKLLPMFQTYLAKFPQQVGLLHFYIHAAQIAGQSRVAVGAAKQLATFGFPLEDSHLTHMPGHTFFDVGMYDDALGVATRSVDMDNAAIDCCHPGYYSANRYYHYHNVAFLLYAMAQTGHTADAVALAQREDNVDFMARSYVADQRWKDVLALPYVKGQDYTLTFARGLAYAKLGDANSAQQALADMPKAPADSPWRAALFNTMSLVLAAEISEVNHNDAKALQELSDASAVAVKLNGDEYPALYYYSPHLALAVLAAKLGRADVEQAALQAELAASPRSKKAMQMLAQLR